jgi:hypothetical protein
MVIVDKMRARRTKMEVVLIHNIQPVDSGRCIELHAQDQGTAQGRQQV